MRTLIQLLITNAFLLILRFHGAYDTGTTAPAIAYTERSKRLFMNSYQIISKWLHFIFNNEVNMYTFVRDDFQCHKAIYCLILSQ